MEDQYRVNEFENLKGGRSQTQKGQESDAQRRYGDILGHSYPFPLRHARMPVEDRAAQFASFAALNGYEEAVEEEARLTEREIDLDDSVREMINQTLVEAEEQLMRGETVRLSVTGRAQGWRRLPNGSRTIEENRLLPAGFVVDGNKEWKSAWT